jgi:threonine dehydratase
VIGLADVEAAARRLEGIAHRTPVFTSRTLDERTGGEVVLKAESLQRGGAFKFRGAYNRISSLSDDERARGVVTASSGNHAQAVALAAGLCGTSALVLMPDDAPASKREATQGYGADVVGYDRYGEDRDALLAATAADTGRIVVHAYDDPLVMAGQGTVALELLADAGPLDVLVVPVGGGGLIAGCAVAVGDTVKIIAVETEGTPTLHEARRAGRPVEVKISGIAADALGASRIGAPNFEIAQKLVRDCLLVSDEVVRAAQRALWEELRVVAEPSGATGLAALMAGVYKPAPGERVATLVCGANTEPGSVA